MKFVIEDVPVNPTANNPAKPRAIVTDVIEAMKQLKVGQSFRVPYVDSTHRTAITSCSHWSGKVFRMAKHSDGSFRLGRVK